MSERKALLSNMAAACLPLLLLSATCLADQPRVAFATSASGTGDLSSWAEAGGASGVAAGDAVCQARATAAGLLNPQNFVAWLSDDISDAWCRIHGLTGKRGSNCGQSALPQAAGPWVRTDGQPFAEAIERIVPPFNQVLLPLRFDEFGNALGTDLGMWTGTTDQGAMDASTCSNWTIGSFGTGFSGRQGSTGQTTFSWTAGRSQNCGASTERLLCLEREPGPALPERSVDGLIVFLSASSGTGDLSSWSLAGGETGLAAADAVCRAEAVQAGLPEPDSFKAWLSTDETNAIDRLEGRGPWVRLDGIPVAANNAELVSGEVFGPITLQANGDHTFRATWTGTNISGLSAPSNCDGWTSASDEKESAVGSSNSIDHWWTDRPFIRACNGLNRLYCLQDLFITEIFADRFDLQVK